MRTHAPAILRMEVVRRWRAMQENALQLVALAIAGLFFLIPVGAGVFGGFFLGRELATTGQPDLVGPLLPAARTAAAAIVAVLAVIVAFRTVQQTGTPDHPDGILLVASHRDVVAALCGIEFLLFAGMFGVPALLGTLAFAVGAGSVTAALLLAAALASTLALGVVAGFALGLAVKIAFARVELLARYKTHIGVALFVVYFAVVLNQEAQSAFTPILDLLAATPLGWFGDLALVTLYEPAVELYAGAAVAIAVAGIPVAFVAASRFASLLWYSTPVQPAEETVESGLSTSGLSTAGLVPRPTERIVRKTWLRARRSPLRLVFVAYPLFIFIGPFADGILQGIPPSLSVTIAIYGAWATGAAFTLNPLGDEGPVLPVTLTSPVDGRTFVRALCLAALVVGVPVTVLATAAAAVLAGMPPLQVVGVTALAAVLTVAAPPLATGVGVAFPRLEAVKAVGNREMIVPSLFAFAVYSLGLLLAGLPGVAGAGIALFAGDTFGVSPGALVLAGVAVTVVVLGGAAGLSYRSAVAAFDGYTFD